MPAEAVNIQDIGHQDLALYGGEPVRARSLPYGHQTIDEEDIEAVVDVLRSEWITTGPKVAAFERAVAAYVGARDAVAFSSGTAALHAAVFAADVGPGDEAITTPLTFCATANCVLYQGATPVFADVSPDTLTVSPTDVSRRMTRHTKVILPVDYAGHPAELDAIMELAERRGAVVIEDACHALGAEYRGRRVGRIAHMTVFSFHPVKHITTGEGGLVATDNPVFADRLRVFRNHGIEQQPQATELHGPWYYEMVALGYNYRLTDIGCALGLSQLRKLHANLARRRAIASRYTASFQSTHGIIPPVTRPEANPAWHLYPIRLDLKKLRVGRRQVFLALRAENIGVAVHHIPVHLHPYYRRRFGYRGGEYPAAEEAYTRLISLPMFHGMSDQDVDDVIEAVRKVQRSYAA